MFFFPLLLRLLYLPFLGAVRLSVRGTSVVPISPPQLSPFTTTYLFVSVWLCMRASVIVLCSFFLYAR